MQRADGHLIVEGEDGCWPFSDARPLKQRTRRGVAVGHRRAASHDPLRARLEPRFQQSAMVASRTFGRPARICRGVHEVADAPMSERNEVPCGEIAASFTVGSDHAYVRVLTVILE